MLALRRINTLNRYFDEKGNNGRISGILMKNCLKSISTFFDFNKNLKKYRDFGRRENENQFKIKIRRKINHFELNKNKFISFSFSF